MVRSQFYAGNSTLFFFSISTGCARAIDTVGPWIQFGTVCRRRLDPGVRELRSGLAWKIVARFCSLYPFSPTLPHHIFLSWVLPLCSSRSLCRSSWWFWDFGSLHQEACFTLGSHSSMVKLVVPLRVCGGCRHLHALRRRSVVQVVSLVWAFLEYLAMDNFRYVGAPGRLAAEGGGGNGAPRPLPSSRRTPAVTFVVPARLYSYGHRSCRPQPLGSR